MCCVCVDDVYVSDNVERSNLIAAIFLGHLSFWVIEHWVVGVEKMDVGIV